jgi:hypothetical protein
MDNEQAARLQELWDRKEIEETLLRYTRGLDRLDLDLYRSAFTADGTDNHGPAKSPDEFLEEWMPKQDGREVTEHIVSNLTIEIDGDTAHVESYHLVAVKQKDEDVVNLHAGRYADRLVRQDGAWRIAVRVVMPSWHGRVSSAVGSPILSRSDWGRRSTEDPTYDRPLQAR